MSKAREIAEERFAKGEITEDEFSTIVSKLPSEKSTSEKTGKKYKYSKYFLYLIGFVIAINILVAVTSGGASANLKLTNVKASRGLVAFVITNNGTRTDDVLVYARTKNGLNKCPYIFQMRPGAVDMKMECPLSESDKISLYASWASSGKQEEMLRIAKRQTINW